MNEIEVTESSYDWSTDQFRWAWLYFCDWLMRVDPQVDESELGGGG